MAASSNLPWKPTTSFGATRRAYTISRFKGPSYSYGESAYHLPITLYKLLSGVTFVNIQTAPDDQGKKIFEYFEPGVGTGLRVFLQKKSRTVICIDCAIGRNDSGGLFFGPNEVFNKT